MRARWIFPAPAGAQARAKRSNSEGEALQQQDRLEGYGFSDWNPVGDIAGSVLQGYHSDEYIRGEAVQWLREKGAGLNTDGTPFFLAVNFVNPHDIMYFNPTGQEAAMHTSGIPGNTVYTQGYDYLPSAWDHASYAEGGIPAHREYHDLWNGTIGDLPADEVLVRQFNDYYLNCIQDQDNTLMGLLTELERLGMMENTIIIFTSDHGEMAGAHGLKGKGNFMYDDNIHVPFILYHPEIAGGQRVGAVTSHLDILPTIVDTAGSPQLSQDVAGHSLLPLLSGEVESVRDGALYAFGMVSVIDSGYDPMSGGKELDMTKRGLVRGIVTERYKFARYFSPLDFNTPATLDDLYAHNDVELYDLENDPDELVNLAADRETHAALIEELNRQLNELIAAEIGVDDGGEMAATFKFFGVSP